MMSPTVAQVPQHNQPVGSGEAEMSISVTELRRNTARVLALTGDLGSCVTITRRGRPVAVLMSVESYLRLRAEHEDLRGRFRLGEHDLRLPRLANAQAAEASDSLNEDG